MFYSTKYTKNLVLTSLSYIIIAVGILWKYYSFWLRQDGIKIIWQKITNDWNSVRTPIEFEIIKTTATEARVHLRTFSLIILCAGICIMLSPHWSIFLDVIMPLNESRPPQLPVMLYLPFDQQKHFYLAAFFIDNVTLVVCITILATESCTLVFLKHAAGLLRIVRYRIRVVLPNNSATIIKSKEEHSLTLETVIDAHADALRFCKYVKSTFLPSYVVLLGFGIGALAINLYCLAQSIVVTTIKEIVLSGTVSTAIFAYMFYLNYLIQQVLNECQYLTLESYGSNWSDVPLPTQKLFLFFLMKCLKGFSFDGFGLIRPSMEGFSSMARLSVSYFMVLYSTQ